jgi:hypothetical protein
MPFLRSNYTELAKDYGPIAATRMNTHLHIARIYSRRGHLLAMATNRVASRSRGGSEFTMHAERAVLKAVGDTTLLRGATLVVLRISVTGDLLLSKPCHECDCCLQAAIRKYGLRRVYYS